MTSTDPNSDANVKNAIKNVEVNIEKLDNQLQTFIAHRHLLETCKLDYSYGSDTGGNEVLLAQIHRLQSENQEILETLKIKCDTLEVYRTKYLTLVGVVEEQRTEIGKIKFESKSVLGKITDGFRSTLNQLTEQFQTLTQLPKILKDKHNECTETKQKLLVAEKALETMSRDLESCICQNEQLKENVQKQGLAIQLSNERLSTVLPDYEELQIKHKSLEQLESDNKAKDEAILDLKKQLEILKNKSSDYISQMKERSEQRRKVQIAKIAEQEEEIVQLKTALKALLLDYDEIKQKMKQKIQKLEQQLRLTNVESN